MDVVPNEVRSYSVVTLRSSNMLGVGFGTVFLGFRHQITGEQRVRVSAMVFCDRKQFRAVGKTQTLCVGEERSFVASEQISHHRFCRKTND